MMRDWSCDGARKRMGRWDMRGLVDGSLPGGSFTAGSLPDGSLAAESLTAGSLLSGRGGALGLTACLGARARLALSAFFLAGLMLLTSGCATAPTSGGFGPIGGQPSTLLQGAGIDEARSVAMASARSKGWTLASAGDPQSTAEASQPAGLILERDLSATAAQSVALGALPGGPAPKVRVLVTLAPQEVGTEVGLRAFVIVNPGTENEKQLEYTDDYADDLAVSLSALQSAWLATGHRLAEAAPVPEAPAPAPDNLLDPNADGAAATSSAAGSDEAGPASRESMLAEATQAEDATRSSRMLVAGSGVVGAQPSPAPSPVPNPAPSPAQELGVVGASANPEARMTGTSAGLLSTGDMLASAPADASGGAPVSNRMLVLDPGSRGGTWSYYAEQLARSRGCEVTDEGAVLLRKTPGFELHEVACRDGANQLVKCEGGVCRSMQ